jgi:hypothetical protein
MLILNFIFKVPEIHPHEDLPALVGLFLVLVSSSGISRPGWADQGPPEIRFVNGRFEPSELVIQAGTAFSIRVTNVSDAPIEFESFELHRERSLLQARPSPSTSLRSSPDRSVLRRLPQRSPRRRDRRQVESVGRAAKFDRDRRARRTAATLSIPRSNPPVESDLDAPPAVKRRFVDPATTVTPTRPAGLGMAISPPFHGSSTTMSLRGDGD